jgi:hypothetical protein
MEYLNLQSLEFLKIVGENLGFFIFSVFSFVAVLKAIV